MKDVRIKRALLSVYVKDGIVDLAKDLSSMGIEIISTSKTAKMIADAGIKVTKIEDVTNFPEILGGRVKTLHPNIFAGILARREMKEDSESLQKLSIKQIDLVVVNLYPFVETVSKPSVTLAEAIENIDIGGPSMIRASAKNFKDVAVVTDHRDYSAVVDELKKNSGSISYETRARLACKAFALTNSYDGHVSAYLSSCLGTHTESAKDASKLGDKIELSLSKSAKLRYGENPHQEAALYTVKGWETSHTLAGVRPIQGKEISYNNLLDAMGAISVVRDIRGKHVAAIIKHTNPCGAARSEKNLIDAYRKALSCDPVSAFGGITCFSGEVDGELATEINKLFSEVIIAPSFSDDALKIFAKKKNLRLLKLDAKGTYPLKYDLKVINGGVLVQEPDSATDDRSNAKVVTKREPTDEEMETLSFAMNICKNVKSNAIVIANSVQTVGIGAGQTSRVDSCKIAIMKAQASLKGCVLASDAFFPFRDSIDLVAKEGITAVIEPGGSLNDEEVIKACDEHGIAMIFTGLRHFKH